MRQNAALANKEMAVGGGERDRTDDLLRARQALSQLSYTPVAGFFIRENVLMKTKHVVFRCAGGPGRT